ncbi:MAG: sulfatase-like hydrolase/transferase [Proteobacteria bacterium]|nr:sulfatase-like hydrolase/transferase [Pseudomonadota bacterium]
MKPIKLLTLLILMIAMSGWALAVNSAERPNVVLMLADNLGFGDIGAYGGGAVLGTPTPSLDALAADGLMLTQFFVEPGCTPSRAGLMTGRYSVRSGLNSIIVAGTPLTLKDEEFTIAELFKQHGYHTGMMGKWHLGQEAQSLPTNQGFDTYQVGILETTDGTLYPESMRRSGLSEAAIEQAQPYIWASNESGELEKVRPYDLAYRDEIEGDIARAASAFIEANADEDEPFFLYVGWSSVHYPVGVSEAFRGRSPAGRYGDMFIEHDHSVGVVLDAIDDAGIRDNTVVIYISDNGPVSHEGKDHDFLGSSAGPFRGEVGDVLEGSLRVPGIVRWPGQVPARKSNEMVAIHDFLPTFAALLDDTLPAERPIDGRNQLPFFLGESDSSAREDYIAFIDGEISAVRWRHWRIYPKQIIASSGNPSAHGVYATRAEGTGYPAIFNITRDPREEMNVVGTEAWVIGAYMKIIGAYQESIKEYPNPQGFSLTTFPK